MFWLMGDSLDRHRRLLGRRLVRRLIR
jgi:hypothetical protein